MTDGARQIAERVVQALEAADAPVAALPGRAAGCVLIALGSSPAEHEVLARQLAAAFRLDLVGAMEAMVRRARALAQIGDGPS